MADADLALEIEAAKRAFDAAIGDPPALLIAWQRLNALCEQRRLLESEQTPESAV